MSEVPLYGGIEPTLKVLEATLTFPPECLKTLVLRTRHTLEPLDWHWSHWPGRRKQPSLGLSCSCRQTHSRPLSRSPAMRWGLGLSFSCRVKNRFDPPPQYSRVLCRPQGLGVTADPTPTPYTPCLPYDARHRIWSQLLVSSEPLAPPLTLSCDALGVAVSSQESATFRGGGRPLLREGAPISYEPRPSASLSTLSLAWMRRGSGFGTVGGATRAPPHALLRCVGRLRFRVQGAGCGVQSVGCRVHGLRFSVEGQLTRIGHIPGGGAATFAGGWPD